MTLAVDILLLRLVIGATANKKLPVGSETVRPPTFRPQQIDYKWMKSTERSGYVKKIEAETPNLLKTLIR